MEDYLTNVKPLILKNTTIERPKIKRPVVRVSQKSEQNILIERFAKATLQPMNRKTKRHFQDERTIDLHGLTVNAAFTALWRFLESCQNDGVKKVLIITGGNALRDTILRKSFQTWVRENFGNYIISCTTANIWHGGQGAFYAILKRKK